MPGKSDPLLTTVWSRPPRPSGNQPTLSREQIVRSAMELLDAEGLAGLSMRRLGSRLGSGATSIYWYVANKDELLDLVLDEAMGEVPVPDADEVGWRAAAAAMARGVRDVILRHPWVTSLFGVRPNIGPQAMRLSERAVTLLQRAGFTGMDVANASSLLMAHAIGSATTEAAWHAAVARSGMTPEEMEESIKAHHEAFTSGHPHLEKWWQEVQPYDMISAYETSFTFGLARLLDGLEAWLAANSGPSA